MARRRAGLDARIHVDGVRELSRAIRQAKDKDLGRELRLANKDAAQEVKTAAEPHVPVGPSGKLKRSLAVRASQRDASVKAGGARVPYAPVIHWGWPARNIKEQRFIRAGLRAAAARVRDKYQDAVDRVARKFGRRGL